MPSARNSAAMVFSEAHNSLFIHGGSGDCHGWHCNNIFEYNFDTQQCHERHVHNRRKTTGHVAFFYKGCIYWWGGSREEKGFDEVYKWDVDDPGNTVETVHATGTKPNGHRGEITGAFWEAMGYLFICGGDGGNDGTFHRYDVGESKWTQLADAAVTMLYGTVAGFYEAEKAMFVWGGHSNAVEKKINDLWKYDTTADEWKKVPQQTPPSPRFKSGGAIEEKTGSLIVFGGYTDPDTYLGDLHVASLAGPSRFDPSSFDDVFRALRENMMTAANGTFNTIQTTLQAYIQKVEACADAHGFAQNVATYDDYMTAKDAHEKAVQNGETACATHTTDCNDMKIKGQDLHNAIQSIANSYIFPEQPEYGLFDFYLKDVDTKLDDGKSKHSAWKTAAELCEKSELTCNSKANEAQQECTTLNTKAMTGKAAYDNCYNLEKGEKEGYEKSIENLVDQEKKHIEDLEQVICIVHAAVKNHGSAPKTDSAISCTETGTPESGKFEYKCECTSASSPPKVWYSITYTAQITLLPTPARHMEWDTKGCPGPKCHVQLTGRYTLSVGSMKFPLPYAMTLSCCDPGTAEHDYSKAALMSNTNYFGSGTATSLKISGSNCSAKVYKGEEVGTEYSATFTTGDHDESDALEGLSSMKIVYGGNGA